MKKVYVVGADRLIESIFRKRQDKYEVVNICQNAEVIVFPGGADVDPRRYGEERHFTTHPSPDVEARNERYYDLRKLNPDITMIGICFGGQFLNVLNGGRMWQDVNNHTSDHMMFDLTEMEPVEVTSTHHQMMIPGTAGQVLGVAHIASRWEGDKLKYKSKSPDHRDPGHPQQDIEVVWYPETRSLCFQPHPEYHHQPTEDYFFRLLDKIL